MFQARSHEKDYLIYMKADAVNGMARNISEMQRLIREVNGTARGQFTGDGVDRSGKTHFRILYQIL